VFGISAVIGPTLGAFLIEHANWSGVFWVNLPIGVLAMVMLGAFLREQRHQKPPPIDFLASLLLAVGAGALMLVMIQAAQLPVWLLVVLVAVGIVALWTLVREPLFFGLVHPMSGSGEPRSQPLDTSRHAPA
jgi:MFS family permease